MVETAVILAAGLGSRLGIRTKDMPKGFLELEGKSLIQRSLDSLFSSGIKKIFIGTGYLSEYYDELSDENPQIKTIKSDKYKSTSSMYTLYNMRNEIPDDFILLESDLLYEQRALVSLLEDPESDIILGSGSTHSNDEVFIQTDSNQKLQKMSKDPEALNSIDAELVGISKVSMNRFLLMNEYFEKVMDENPKIDYEYIFQETSVLNPIAVKVINDLIWCEIDDENHLNRALTQVLPRIGEKDE